jgi:hypothetical protein
VRLWLDADGDGTLGTGETAVYEGRLAGLSTLSDGVPLVPCATAGTYRVRLHWHLPPTVGNEVQTDRAALDLRFGATDCGGPNPFGG